MVSAGMRRKREKEKRRGKEIDRQSYHNTFVLIVYHHMMEVFIRSCVLVELPFHLSRTTETEAFGQGCQCSVMFGVIVSTQLSVS